MIKAISVLIELKLREYKLERTYLTLLVCNKLFKHIIMFK